MIRRQASRRHARQRPTGNRRPGFALILVLIVVAMLSLSAYTFTNLMVTENEGAILHGRQLQARSLVDSAANHLRFTLELPEIDRLNLGGLYENPTLFQAQLVQDDLQPEGRGRFSVVSPALDDLGVYRGLRFGLEDESSRLNLNALSLDVPDDMLDDGSDSGGSGGDNGGGSGGDNGGDSGGNGGTGGDNGGNGGSGGDTGGNNGDNGGDGGSDEQDEESEDDDGMIGPEDIDTSGRAVLMQLPGMTIDIADAILDYLDEDDEPREYGAEIEYYASLNPPYAPKNGPLETVEELLQVRGMTPDLLFGRDINRNGILDPHEANLPIYNPADMGDGMLDRGWAGLLTLYSAEKNTNAEGLPRIDLNGDDLELLYDELSAVLDPSWAAFIIAYRQNGPYEEDDEGDGEIPQTVPISGESLDLTKAGNTKLTQVLDLIGVNVQAPSEGEDNEPAIYESPFPDEPSAMASYLPTLMDNCTINPETTIPGRVNINRAPLAVLLSIPGMAPEIADAIIAQRDLYNGEFDTELSHETWLLSRGIVTLEEMKLLIPFITAGGDVYRAQLVGYYDAGEISSRVEVIVDATQAVPRLLFWNDISHLGRGYARETLGILYQAQ